MLRRVLSPLPRVLPADVPNGLSCSGITHRRRAMEEKEAYKPVGNPTFGTGITLTFCSFYTPM